MDTEIAKTPTKAAFDEMDEFGFDTAEECQAYIDKTKEAPRRYEYYLKLKGKIPDHKLPAIEKIAHRLIYGYENDLYKAIEDYVVDGTEPDFSDSRVMTIMFNKVKAALDASDDDGEEEA